MRISLLFLILITFACVQKEPTRSPGSSSSASGLPLKWTSLKIKQTGGLALSVSNTTYALLGGSTSILDDMANQWNDADSLHNFIITPMQVNIANKAHGTALAGYHDSTMGIYTNDSWFPNISSGTLAVTQFYGIKRNVGSFSEYVEMTHADIIINTRDFIFSTQNSSTRLSVASSNNTAVPYDIASVVLHEMGHFIGLGHQYSTYNSVMYPSISSTDDHRTVSSVDINTIVANYDNSVALTAGLSIGGPSGPATNDSFAIPVENYGSNSSNQVSGTIELRKDGQCKHYINGKLIGTH